MPAPNDRVREDELKIVPFIEAQVGLGFRPLAIERLLRVTGESMRRIAARLGVAVNTVLKVSRGPFEGQAPPPREALTPELIPLLTIPLQ